jgi:hypothetical protein
MAPGVTPGVMVWSKRPDMVIHEDEPFNYRLLPAEADPGRAGRATACPSAPSPSPPTSSAPPTVTGWAPGR